jgi:hypothetical protein
MLFLIINFEQNIFEMLSANLKIYLSFTLTYNGDLLFVLVNKKNKLDLHEKSFCIE